MNFSVLPKEAMTFCYTQLDTVVGINQDLKILKTIYCRQFKTYTIHGNNDEETIQSLPVLSCISPLHPLLGNVLGFTLNEFSISMSSHLLAL